MTPVWWIWGGLFSEHPERTLRKHSERHTIVLASRNSLNQRVNLKMLVDLFIQQPKKMCAEEVHFKMYECHCIKSNSICVSSFFVTIFNQLIPECFSIKVWRICILFWTVSFKHLDTILMFLKQGFKTLTNKFSLSFF